MDSLGNQSSTASAELRVWENRVPSVCRSKCQREKSHGEKIPEVCGGSPPGIQGCTTVAQDIAVARVQSLAQELLHAVSAAKKKEKKKKNLAKYC